MKIWERHGLIAAPFVILTVLLGRGAETIRLAYWRLMFGWEIGRNVRVHGFRFRRHLFRGTPDERFDWTVQMLEYMASFDDVEFMTMRQYALQHAEFGDGNQ